MWGVAAFVYFGMLFERSSASAMADRLMVDFAVSAASIGALAALTALAAGLGGLCATAPLALLVDALGWRAPLAASGVVLLGVAALCWAVIRDRPSDLELPSWDEVEAGQRRRSDGPTATRLG